MFRFPRICPNRVKNVRPYYFSGDYGSEDDRPFTIYAFSKKDLLVELIRRDPVHFLNVIHILLEKDIPEMEEIIGNLNQMAARTGERDFEDWRDFGEIFDHYLSDEIFEEKELYGKVRRDAYKIVENIDLEKYIELTDLETYIP